MPIEFKFRHLEPSEAIRTYATDKLNKLQKYLRDPLDAHMTFSLERRLHCVDVSFSNGGERFQARAEQEDMYASIDIVVDKIQRQVNRAHGQHSKYRRGPHPEPGGESPGE
jgi:putative sigma-54 modulation protein